MHHRPRVVLSAFASDDMTAFPDGCMGFQGRTTASPSDLAFGKPDASQTPETKVL
jgi:hypothetical protein